MHVKKQRETFALNESNGSAKTIPEMEPELFFIIENELEMHDSLRDGMLTSQELEFEPAVDNEEEKGSETGRVLPDNGGEAKVSPI